ncbi:MAG TPA: sigma-70 family RNA polymerase sigma factor [Actinomycetota bacterium]|nr:sigma-70 family RNA polymerase sigma factor [Actinomycetota bacterium]
MEGRPLEDEELVERARAGDVAAYEELVRSYQDMAARAAYVLAGPAEAEDAVQEAFVKAYRALPSFRPGSRFRPWLLRIVANEAIDRRRSARRAAGLVLRVAETGWATEDRPLGGAAPSPEEAVLRREEAEEVVRAVSLLRPKDRLVIAYRYWLELSEDEMALVLGCPRGTVKSRLSRALARLRQHLQPAARSDPESPLPRSPATEAGPARAVARRT